MSEIHCLLSRGYRVIMVDNSSIKFGIADRGATPAKPNRIARMIWKPCVCARLAFAVARSSFVAVRVMRELCARGQFHLMGQGSKMVLTRNVEADVREYRSWRDSAPMAHWTNPSKRPAGRR